MVPKDSEYTLSVTPYKNRTELEDKVADIYIFKVSSLITEPLLPPIKEAPITVSLVPEFQGTVEIRSATSGKVYDRSKLYGGGDILLGQTLTELGIFDIVITDSGGNVIKSRTVIDSRYPVVSLGTLQTTIYLPSLPYTVKMADFAEILKIYIDGEWNTITMPGYVTFDAYACYNARYYLEGVWRDAVVCTSPIDTSFKDIC